MVQEAGSVPRGKHLRLVSPVLASPGSLDSPVLALPRSHDSPVLASAGSQLYMTVTP